VLFVHNFDSKPREISFSIGLSDPGVESRLFNLLSEDHSRGDKDDKHRLVIEGYGYRWYRIGGLDYLLRRSENESTHLPATD
jgi:maltose alpha-D-glucosyltransferase / alpha-amylase